MSPKKAAILASVLIALPALSSAAGPRSKPVTVGGESSFDACGGVGQVAGLNPKGDSFLAVRAGPGTRYRVIDKIKLGQDYFDCDEHRNWVGIVYSSDPEATCGVTSVIAKRRAYRGPCKSGWIYRKYTKLIAG